LLHTYAAAAAATTTVAATTATDSEPAQRAVAHTAAGAKRARHDAATATAAAAAVEHAPPAEHSIRNDRLEDGEIVDHSRSLISNSGAKPTETGVTGEPSQPTAPRSGGIAPDSKLLESEDPRHDKDEEAAAAEEKEEDAKGGGGDPASQGMQRMDAANMEVKVEKEEEIREEMLPPSQESEDKVGVPSQPQSDEGDAHEVVHQDEEEDEDQFEVSLVVDARDTRDGSGREYRLRWKVCHTASVAYILLQHALMD
jgi:hypothetical protein